MIDLVKLTLQAGDGGNGRVSLLREKYRPKGGPDGGNGGRGGSIILRANKNLNTLGHYAGSKVIEAQRGQDGLKKNKSGQNAEDLILEVPVGTIIWELAQLDERQVRASKQEKYFLEREGQRVPKKESEKWLDALGNKLDKGSREYELLNSHSIKNIDLKNTEKRKLLEISEDTQEVIICQGGVGGRGNATFKGPGKQVPLEAEYGQKGEKRIVLLELQLLADIGLVGYPSAGKSTFLSVVTKARPKIAAYHFTTLEAGLGVMQLDGKELVVADIPGLIEGASQGKGLGFEFLRHVERCRLLLYILSLDLADMSEDSTDSAKKLLDQFEILRKEITDYEEKLNDKKYFIAINKIDLYPPDLLKAFEKEAKKQDLEINFISCATGEGIEELKKKLLVVMPA